ncbi:hypothetical protein AB8B21_27880 [Tardiphaga sp. 866_E4_N2_1]|uniref:hypothetical protein n=1 Tax=unclassified Tardiphaga TaxID=2631404 RepID=UPI003F26A07C
MFDFKSIRLSKLARNQLEACQRTASRATGGSRATVTNEKLIALQLDAQRGYYLPLADSILVAKKLTDNINSRVPAVIPANGADIQFFTNALVLPTPNTPLEDVLDARHRLTNPGHQVITLEFDPQNLDQFEEMLSWIRRGGPFGRFDKLLRRSSEYRGYSVVYSGGRSLHIHLLFDTKHIRAAPYDALWHERLEKTLEHSAVMEAVHHRLWDHCAVLFESAVRPSFPVDRALRSPTQWRRFGFGWRKHEEVSKVLGIPAGSVVPQLVLREDILSRAPRGSTGWLVAPEFSVSAIPRRAPKSKLSSASLSTSIEGQLLEELCEACREEFGEFPRPEKIANVGGEWSIYFKNGDADRNPSSVVRGANRRILLQGVQSFGVDFYLPGGLSAQETVEDLLLRHRLASGSDRPFSDGSPPVPPTRWKGKLPAENGLLPDEMAAQIQRQMRRTSNGSELVCQKINVRRSLRHGVQLARHFIPSRDVSRRYGDSLLISVEGAGKTTGHFDILANEALDEAMDRKDDVQAFPVFAFRSIAQAEEKRAEYLRRAGGHGRGAFVLRSFWNHYEDACRTVRAQPIQKHHFADGSPHGVMAQILTDQPDVFSELERVRKSMWSEAQFNGGSTVIMTTHSMLQSWPNSHLTRVWHHADFDPLNRNQDCEGLRSQFKFLRIVHDELEIDEIVDVLPEKLFDHLRDVHAQYPNWRNLPRRERYQIFQNREKFDRCPSTFDEYNAAMYIDLDKLEEVKVDFDKIPFGVEHTAGAIYKKAHGDRYYLGVRSWLFKDQAQISFLTTERLVGTVLQAVYEKSDRYLFRQDLDDVPGMYPIKVPLMLDSGASAREIEGLAKRLVRENTNAVVIANRVGGIERCYSFQAAKGANDMQSNDIVVILTMLNPAEYAKLNVLGQWLGLDDVILQHYTALINQAVGRNTGFRQQEGTSVTVIASPRMWSGVLKKLGPQHGCRVDLQPQPKAKPKKAA